MRRRTWTDAQMIKAVSNNISIRGVLRELGLLCSGGNYMTVHAAVKRLELDTLHWKGQGHGLSPGTYKRALLKDILVANSTYANSGYLKARLLKAGLLENACYICGQQPIWKKRKLVMVIDHINGKNRDHRIENLRLLCPNCNSQQATFAGRNRKINRIATTNKCRICGKRLTGRRKYNMCFICEHKDRKGRVM